MILAAVVPAIEHAVASFGRARVDRRRFMKAMRLCALTLVFVLALFAAPAAFAFESGYSAASDTGLSATAHKHHWSGWTVEEKATKFQNGLKYRYCRDCGKDQYVKTAKKPMTANDKKAVATAKKFLKGLRKYDVKTMRTVYSSKSKDFLGAIVDKVYRKQFRENFSYGFLSVSSTSVSAKIKVDMVYPTAYRGWRKAYVGWYHWLLKRYPNVSEEAAAQELLDRTKRRVVDENFDTRSDTFVLKLKKEGGKWKVASTKKLRDILDGGKDEAYASFESEYLS